MANNCNLESEEPKSGDKMEFDDVPVQKSVFQTLSPLIRKIVFEQKGVIDENNAIMEHQVNALQFIDKWFLEDNPLRSSQCVIVLPTGTGKSLVAVLAPFLLSVSRCLVITPSNATNIQMKEEFQGRSIDKIAMESSLLVKRNIISVEVLREKQIAIGVTEEKKMKNWIEAERNPVTVANAQQFTKKPKSTKDWNKMYFKGFGVVIVDEAHHFPSSFWYDVVKKAQENNVRVIFLTGTPWRCDGQEVIDTISKTSVFKGSSVYQQFKRSWFRLPRSEAINAGIIRNFNAVVLEDELQSVADPEGGGEKTRSTTNSLYISTLRNVFRILDEKDTSFPLPSGRHRAMILASSIIEADKISKFANECGFEIAIYNSHLKKPSLKREKGNFESDKVRAIIVVGCLREGYDFPPVSVTAFTKRVTSQVKFEQFIGRGVRRVRNPTHENPDIRCDVVYHKSLKLDQFFVNCIKEKFCQSIEDEMVTDEVAI